MPRLHRSPRPAGAWLTRTLALGAVLGFTACSAGAQDESAAEPAGAGEGQAAAQPAVERPRGSTDEYAITIGSGPFQGTHEGSGEMNCFAQDGTWGADITIERDRGVTGILMMLTGVPEDGGSTEDVNLGLLFGQVGDMSPNSGGLGIGAASGGGAGRATVERDGPGATIRIEGTTPYGAPVSAVIRCHDLG